MRDPKISTRKIIVEGVEIWHSGPSQSRFKKHPILRHEQAEDSWEVMVTLRNGLLPSRTTFERCYSEDEAIELERKYQIGSELSDSHFDEALLLKIIRAIVDKGHFVGVYAGDRESPLALNTLAEAGIYCQDLMTLSKEVIKSVGKDRIRKLKDSFGENWTFAAAFEYAFVYLPQSSPAFVAASYHYHTYITRDDFSAGYFWRDLEVLVEGIEIEAFKAIETRKKAGLGGSRKSRFSREARRTKLFEKMLEIIERNPDALDFGAEAVSKVALKECIKEDASLWRQGKGQFLEYIGEIRRGEAGPEMKSRFFAAFGSKPLKRF
jgi:hypothetical protein